MPHNVVEQCGHVLENAFFAHQDEVLLERLRAEARDMERRQLLAAASGITDQAVLQHWVDLGLTAHSLAALSLLPLLMVAWADGSLDPREAEAVKEAAQAGGLRDSPEAAALLDAWLARPPGPEMEKAWQDYVRALAPTMSAEAREALHRETIGRARRVAETAGGFLGFGNRVSDSERRMLERLETAFG
ncbi:hypothetical protein [Falsiroseomonas sp. HW251]|uniref:hypothetical protein n=1 Tax=Falsiroseomonas sp. HW251 TaxID=3390998 RepID=UPI003D31E98C